MALNAESVPAKSRSSAAQRIQEQVRTRSRSGWNTYVGIHVAREVAAWSIAGLLALVTCVACAGWWQATHQMPLPPAVVTVDQYGQVLGVNRPRVVQSMTDVAEKHFFESFTKDVFDTYDSATVLLNQYSSAQTFIVPGSSASLGIQAYWDRYSPLRRMADGTWQIPNPPKTTVSVRVTSHLPNGKTSDGWSVREMEWRAVTHGTDGDQPGDLYRGVLEWTQQTWPAGTPDDVIIANPFGIKIRKFTWDKVR